MAVYDVTTHTGSCTEKAMWILRQRQHSQASSHTAGNGITTGALQSHLIKYREEFLHGKDLPRK
jgi:hypothetical protein